MQSDFEISIVIPVFNEAESVPVLLDHIVKSMQDTQINYEIILIDDGSDDGTLQEALNKMASIENLSVVSLKRNFGQTIALNAGFRVARGRFIITLDGDLQNDPADIPILYDKIKEGYDLVLGWRKNRKDGMLLRIIPSVVANWMIRKLAGSDIKDNGCALRAIKKARRTKRRA